MINQPLATSSSMHLPFGSRLKSARESLGLDRKEVATQLRLHEKIIVTMESGDYQTDIPLTFLRGYLRNYSKLLNIPEQEVTDLIESLKPVQPPAEAETVQRAASVSYSQKRPGFSFNADNIVKKVFTLLLLLTLVGLVWWHSHTSTPSDISSSDQIAAIAQPAPNATPVVSAQPKTSAKSFFVTSPEGKAALINFLQSTPGLQYLIQVILFLILLTVSLRIYKRPIMAGLRRPKSSKRLQASRAENKSYAIGKQTYQRLGVIALAAIVLFGGVFWYKHGNKVTHTAKKKPPVVTQQPVAIAPVDISTAPQFTLQTPTSYSLLTTGSKPYFLQDMQYKLQDYINQAANVYFVLTDKSSPFSQFKRKKIRRYRVRYNRDYNQEFNYSNPPPYYYNQ